MINGLWCPKAAAAAANYRGFAMTSRPILLRLRSLLVACMALTWCQAARADFLVPINLINNNGNQVYAQANFAFSSGTLTITLRNLLGNPKAINQNLSGIQFHVRGLATPLELVSSSALERNVFIKGSYSDLGSISSGWGNASAAGTTFLNALDSSAMGPLRSMHTLIGDPDANNLYSSANASIAGSGPHNSFLAGTLTFVLTNSLLNANSMLDGNVLFQFGTDGGNQFEVPTGPGPGGVVVPAPPTAILAGVGGLSLGLSGLFGWRRRGRRYEFAPVPSKSK
jgi:hypothetical protein